MATTGLSTYLHAERNETTGKYAAPSKLAGAIDFKEQLDRNDAKLYADNELQDSDTSVTGGKITMTVDDDDDTIFAPVLGETVKTVTIGEKTYSKILSKTSDVPVEQGFGFITKKNKGKYRVTFYPRVKFTRGDEEAKTAEDKTEYTKPTVEGTLYPVNGVYKEKVTVDTLEEAVTVLQSLFTPQEDIASGDSTVEPDTTE